MLTPELARDRAMQAIDRARAAGADAADAVLSADTGTGVSVRLGAVEDVERTEGEELSLRVFCGQRTASVSSTRLGDADLADLAARVVAMARAAPEDRWAGLAPEDRLMKGSAPDLDIWDGGAVDPEALRQRALAVEDAARAVAGVTNSEGGSASAHAAVVALVTSHGFAAAYRATSYSLAASVIAGTGSAMQRDSASHSARYQAALDAAEAIGRKAGERAVARLDPVKLGSGAMPVVYDRRIASGLLGHFASAIAGPAIARGTSFLKDAMGARVFAPGIEIVDDPHRPRGLRSRPFDGEGLPVSPMTLVDDGMLETWLLDAASARQLGLEPTGHASRGGGVSTSNLYMAAGHVPRDTLIGEIERGLYVTSLFGQGVNGLTGDYSRGATGFLIEHGEITRPVAEITIAGNLKDMYLALTPASDLEFRYGVNAPTVRIDGMTIAGA
ncbi:TldD/PmbA family protein [Sphingomonas baiyangensis]|uniref:TldD/PmbA family protein n=1 Tax=Sphingomonas baiyangensis TaxID=2572576 RepID=A0A4U1L5B0_9SPHN|nr:metallopeptidase TldD-related protein [Sphingomonas baiyangensis]TKD51992.1 TldD/PmbA family protein [Sphingomonas baiyangensis]